MRIVVWVVLGLAFVGYLVLATRGLKPGTGENNTSAISACEGQVAAQLIAPSTAKFSGWLNSTTRAGPNDSVIVRLYVDSQNSYGAMIRTPYTCTVYPDRTVSVTVDR